MNSTLILYVYIAFGGAAGACLRYFVTNTVDSCFGKQFPFGTLTVNVVGSFLLAIVYGLIEHGSWAEFPHRAFVGVGLLGAFTTFSTFSLETLTLLENGLWEKAMINILLNVFACLLAGWTAILLVKG
ncbi:fluoride efflux transporter CrcB [Alteromonas ponticola]|uniref:fluoride efflux transporter CrcB n=1 Tax=Alteromonas ponticola TaxID=2720613 RepID=UPI0031B5F2A4